MPDCSIRQAAWLFHIFVAYLDSVVETRIFHGLLLAVFEGFITLKVG